MKIIKRFFKSRSLKDFADEHGLTMKLRQEWNSDHKPTYEHSWWATFEPHVQKKYDDMPVCGVGRTEKEAMRNYAWKLSEHRLVIGGYSKDAIEVDCPVLKV